MKTLQALLTDVQHALYQSAGPGVQIYSQDTIIRHINEGFKHCYRAEWWPQFLRRERRVLDETTGKITATLTHITQWDDIRHVFREGSPRPLMQLPPSLSTFNITGTVPKYIEASDTGLFTIYPLEAEGSIEVVGRKSYSDFILTDTVPFDDLALVHYAAWAYFADDGANPASAAKHQGLFESRMKKLRDDSFSHAIPLNPDAGDIPDRWF
jgi:hypothetical protein